MDYNKIGIWAKGYIEALCSGEPISKEQLEKLIARINELIKDAEENLPQVEDHVSNEEEELPF